MQKLEDTCCQVDLSIDCNTFRHEIEEVINSEQQVSFDDHTFKSVLRRQNLQELVKYTKEQDRGEYNFANMLKVSQENYLLKESSIYKHRCMNVQNKYYRAQYQLKQKELLLVERPYIINDNNYIEAILKIQNKRIENNQFISFVQYKQLETIDDCMSVNGANSILRTYGIAALQEYNLNYSVNFKQNIKYLYLHFNKKWLKFTCSLSKANTVFFGIGQYAVMTAIKDIQPNEQIVCYIFEQGNVDNVQKLLEYNTKLYGSDIAELQNNEQISSLITKISEFTSTEDIENHTKLVLQLQTELIDTLNLTATILQQLNKNVAKVSESIISHIDQYFSQDAVKKNIIYDIQSIKQYILLVYQFKQEDSVQILKNSTPFKDIYNNFYGIYISIEQFLEQLNMKDSYKLKQDQLTQGNPQNNITNIQQARLGQMKRDKIVNEVKSKELLDNYYRTKALMEQNEKELQTLE